MTVIAHVQHIDVTAMVYMDKLPQAMSHPIILSAVDEKQMEISCTENYLGDNTFIIYVMIFCENDSLILTNTYISDDHQGNKVQGTSHSTVLYEFFQQTIQRNDTVLSSNNNELGWDEVFDYYIIIIIIDSCKVEKTPLHSCNHGNCDGLVTQEWHGCSYKYSPKSFNLWLCCGWLGRKVNYHLVKF